MSVERHLQLGLSLPELLDWLEKVPYAEESYGQNILKINDAVHDLINYGELAVEPVTERLLPSENKLTQWAALRILREIVDQRAFEPLLQIVQDAEAPIWTRIDVLKVLGKLKDERVFGVALSFLDHEFIPMRQAAVFVFGNLGDRRAVEYLVQVLNTPKRKTYRSPGQFGHLLQNAVDALAKIDHPDARAALIAATHHPKLSVRNRARKRLQALQAGETPQNESTAP
jgi:HEAT repeat protein